MRRHSVGWTESQEDGQIFRRMDRHSVGWTESQEDGQIFRRMDRHSVGWTESQEDELTVIHTHYCGLTIGHTDKRMGWTDRQPGGWTDRLLHRQEERWTVR